MSAFSFGFVADVHVTNPRRFGGPVTAGINRRGREVLDVLRAASLRVHDCGARLVILGDLFDTVRPEPQLLAEVIALLRDLDVPPLVLLGNHEQHSTAIGDHSLAPLNAAGIAVLERPWPVPGSDSHLWLVPYEPGPAREWLPQRVAQLAQETRGWPDRPRVLGLHLGIVHRRTPPFLRDAHDAVTLELLAELVKQHGLAAVYAGNWHSQWAGTAHDAAVVQVGALVPTDWRNPGWDGYGGLALWAPHEQRLVQLPGPRFVNVGLDGLEETLACRWPEHRVYLRVKVQPADVAVALAALDAARTATGGLVEGEVVPDASGARLAARAAAAEASARDTLDGALEAYVGALAMPPGVERARVLARTRGFLREAG